MVERMSMGEVEWVDCALEGAQRIAVLEDTERITLHYAKIPEPGDGELRIKVIWVGICGSDLETYRKHRSPEFFSLPVRLGHEVAGIVDKVGPGVSHIHVGDKVTCRYVWGAFAQYILCKPFNVKVLPPSFPLRQASLIEILPGILHALELAKIDSSTDVLIMGQGVSGLILTQLAKLYSPRSLVVTDLHQENLDIATRYGASHTYRIRDPRDRTMDYLQSDFPAGFGVVIPCMLDGDGMIDALDCCCICAKLIMYGCIGFCTQPFDFFKVHRKRCEIYSTEPRRDIDMRRFFQEGVNMVLDGLVDTDGIVTDEFPLEQIAEAFRRRNDADNGTIHVLLKCNEEDD